MTIPPQPALSATCALLPTLHSSGYQIVWRTVQVTTVGGGPMRIAGAPATAGVTPGIGGPGGGTNGGTTTGDHVWIPVTVSFHVIVSSPLAPSRDHVPSMFAAATWVTDDVPTAPSGHGR